MNLERDSVLFFLGSAAYPSEGTTNLHLDMSDAVNVLVYVGTPYSVSF